MDEYEEMELKTHEAMMNPKVGDRFEEFYTFWMYVVKVSRWHVWTMSASAPCEFPKDGKIEKRTKKEFRKHFSYQTKAPELKNKYWICLCDRNNNVKNWIKPFWKIFKREGSSVG